MSRWTKLAAKAAVYWILTVGSIIVIAYALIALVTHLDQIQ